MKSRSEIELKLAIDSQEQEPLVFTRLQSVRQTLQNGDYSIVGLEALFAVFTSQRNGGSSVKRLWCLQNANQRFKLTKLSLGSSWAHSAPIAKAVRRSGKRSPR
jgi:hypothetical protein